MPHELFCLSSFGFKNCAKLFRIKFCTRKSNSFISEKWVWYLEKQPNLNKWLKLKKKTTFGTEKLRTGIWWDQTLCIFNTPGIVAPALARLDFHSDPLTLDHAPFSRKNTQKVQKVILFFI